VTTLSTGDLLPDLAHPLLPGNQSAVRRFTYDEVGVPYLALLSLEEARAWTDGVVILEGDFGGQIFAVCLAARVGCDEQTLEQLVRELNTIYWPNCPLDGARVFFERLPLGSFVVGGEGGGWVTEDIWVHPWLVDDGLDTTVREVIRGQRPAIGDNTPSHEPQQ
jgi:hypothetical protein